MIKDHPDMADKPELVIRAANRMDAEALARFAQALAREEGRVSRADAASLTAALEAGRAAFLLALVQGKPVGMLMHYAGYDLESASTGRHLADIYVLPEWRRQGVGRRLIAQLAERCLAEGGAWVSLTVLRENAGAHRFYASLAIVEVPVRFMAIGANGLEALMKTTLRD
jgi:GNAT superfamily N-acetyltransferase